MFFLQSPPDGTQFLARPPGTPGAGTVDVVVGGTAELDSKIKVYDGLIQISLAGT
jgi:hypothetical protein